MTFCVIYQILFDLNAILPIIFLFAYYFSIFCFSNWYMRSTFLFTALLLLPNRFLHVRAFFFVSLLNFSAIFRISHQDLLFFRAIFTKIRVFSYWTLPDLSWIIMRPRSAKWTCKKRARRQIASLPEVFFASAVFRFLYLFNASLFSLFSNFSTSLDSQKYFPVSQHTLNFRLNPRFFSSESTKKSTGRKIVRWTLRVGQFFGLNSQEITSFLRKFGNFAYQRVSKFRWVDIPLRE